MPNTKDVMLSVAQVCQIQPGTDEEAAWVNPGVSGVIREIKRVEIKKGKMAGKFMHICTLADVTGPDTISFTYFKAPPFAEQDLVDIFGKGLRVTEYQGEAQLSLGRETQVEIIGKSAHEPEQRAAAAAGTPAVNGKPQQVLGQTVGMAMKEALALMGRDLKRDELIQHLTSASFWQAVHEVASDIIRVSHLLEKGKLAESIKDRLNPKPKAATQQGGRADPPPRPAPAPRREDNVTQGELEEDVPF